jgi:hypothetical protein
VRNAICEYLDDPPPKLAFHAIFANSKSNSHLDLEASLFEQTHETSQSDTRSTSSDPHILVKRGFFEY